MKNETNLKTNCSSNSQKPISQHVQKKEKGQTDKYFIITGTINKLNGYRCYYYTEL